MSVYILGPILAQIMVCSLKAPSHYLNRFWFLISEVLWHAHKSNFTASAQAIILYNEFENYTSKTRYVDSMVISEVTIPFIQSPHHGPTKVMLIVMNDQVTSITFYVNRPIRFWNEAVSNFDLETSRSRSWVWSKDKGIYLSDKLLFHFTSMIATIPEIQLFWNLNLKNPRSRLLVRFKCQGHIIHPLSNWCISYSFHVNRTDHSWDMANRVFEH